MKKLIVIGIILALALNSMPAFAAKGRKGASDKAYEHASEKAIFNRVSDWFATIGKSEEEKKAVLKEREAKRAEKRVRKEVEKKQRMLEKENKKVQKRGRDY